MLLAITKSVTLPRSADEVWALLQQPVQVAGCLPDIKAFEPAAEPGRYTTLLVERLGPFAVQIALTVDVEEDAPRRRMVATISGEDRTGQARVRGDVTATVTPSGVEATLDVSSSVEVLGRMAALGAVPMRRRGDQVFEQFVRNIGMLLEGQHG